MEAIRALPPLADLLRKLEVVYGNNNVEWADYNYFADGKQGDLFVFARLTHKPLIRKYKEGKYTVKENALEVLCRLRGKKDSVWREVSLGFHNEAESIFLRGFDFTDLTNEQVVEEAMRLGNRLLFSEFEEK